jgi:hypothetical protein
MRRRSWILKTVLVEPPPWRQRIRGRVSVGSGAGVVEREGGRVWGERAVGLERESRESAMVVVFEGLVKGMVSHCLGFVELEYCVCLS